MGIQRIIILAVVLTGMLLQPMPAAASQVNFAPAQQAGEFRQAPCMATLPAGVEEGRDVICGYLKVPEEHANPSGPTIELAVVVIKNKDPNPQQDPLVIAQGGPGASTIDTYLDILLSGKHDLGANRDIILFDQRGTLYSKPALQCTEVFNMTVDTLDQDLSQEESARLYQEALGKCYQRLTAQGDNLSAFDSLENAADIDSLRQALGYTQINLYGVSYGTLLALHTMRLFPSGLRSVILDGVVPTQTNFIINVARTENQSFTRLFEACRAAPDCNRSYPDLEKVFFEVVERLNREPARVQFTDTENGTVYENVVINGDTFLEGAFQFMYSSDLIEALPKIIYAAREGNLDVFARILSIFVLDRTNSDGMYFSVLCAEDADFTPTDQDLSGVRPEIARVEESSSEYFLSYCSAWKVTPLGSDVDAPVVSDIPTLILSGAFDPITPPEYAQTAAESLSRSYNYVFPAGGHGQALDSDCANSIINQFLNNPASAPDASCINPNEGPRFYTGKTVIDLPFILEAINLQGTSLITFLLLILAVAFLATSLLVFPLAWMVGAARRKPAPAYAPAVENAPIEAGIYAAAPNTAYHPAAVSPAATERPTLLARLASWWPVLGTIVLTIFLVFLIAAIAGMISENDSRLFFGLPGESRPWFLLPIIFALLSILMLFAGVQAWVKQYGSVWRRVYYTLLALDALVIVLLLAVLGLLTAMF